MTLEELKKVAEAALPEYQELPWTFTPCYTPNMSGQNSPPNAGRVCEAWDDNGYASPEGAKHIATFNPDLVLKLLAVARAAKEHDCAPGDLPDCPICKALAALET